MPNGPALTKPGRRASSPSHAHGLKTPGRSEPGSRASSPSQIHGLKARSPAMQHCEHRRRSRSASPESPDNAPKRVHPQGWRPDRRRWRIQSRPWPAASRSCLRADRHWTRHRRHGTHPSRDCPRAPRRSDGERRHCLHALVLPPRARPLGTRRRPPTTGHRALATVHHPQPPRPFGPPSLHRPLWPRPFALRRVENAPPSRENASARHGFANAPRDVAQ